MHVGTPVLDHSAYQRDSPPDHLQQVQFSVAAQAHHWRRVLVGTRDTQHRTDASQALWTHLPSTHHDDRHTETPGLHLFPSTGRYWPIVQPTGHGRTSKTHWSYYTGMYVHVHVHVHKCQYQVHVCMHLIVILTMVCCTYIYFLISTTLER